MQRLAVLLLVALPFMPVRAEALTLEEIVELHKSGLGDDVLVALIEVNKVIYNLEAETLKGLKSDGLSDRVIIAIINSGRQNLPPPAPPADPAPEPAPPVVIIEHQPAPAAAPQVIVQQVPVYVPVPVTQGRSRPARVQRIVTPPSPFFPGHVREPQPRKAPEPVYWGFGGKLRPDAWQPAGKPAGKKETGEKGKGRGDRR